MLHNLNQLLDKTAAHADAKKFDAQVLLQACLAPDQFHFQRQVQIACDSAKLGVARLTGKEKDAPVHEDNEKSIGELQARIASVVERSVTRPRGRDSCSAGPVGARRDYRLGALQPVRGPAAKGVLGLGSVASAQRTPWPLNRQWAL